ncbi:phospholipase D active site motif protein [Aspergillus ellipticus CBS 707.79]|uniref:Phospholipase D active site motif protein n=1 Tax=Aspergillus ellipticus CBS 707.79 TaxID=1448320 RepID=A0A319DAP2_9EURO|nr:phospholipase D active site motif protein [Aspergillus ellipticus CBS 707.79]
MLSDAVYELCHDDKTVTSELLRDPSQSPPKVFHHLYHDRKPPHHHAGSTEGVDAEGLTKVIECGKWGHAQPSELFLQIYHDALCALEKNPMTGVVSPPLMGSTGVVPLTIIAPLPDLCRHMANCIVRAEKEVILATNFWIHSDASTLVTNAFRELSRRAGERGGAKVVVKMVYDRGDPQQVFENHLPVPEKKYTNDKVHLPAAHEIPHLDLQVVNYHRPIFGTFHSKFMVIDRRIGLLQSSNVQDNDNLEMMQHVEGPIVDGLYDTGLISWGRPLEPPLPMLDSPAADAPIPCHSSQQPDYDAPDPAPGALPELTIHDEHYDPDIRREAQRMNGLLQPREGETRLAAVTRRLNTTIQTDTTADAPESSQEAIMEPYLVLPPHDPFPMALVNREPWGAPNHSSVHTPQNSSFLAAINNAQRSIFIQTPNMNAEPIVLALIEAVKRGVSVTCYLCLGYNDAGELLPFQNGTNEMVAHRMYKALETDEHRAQLRIHNYVAKDQTKPIHNSFKRRSCHIKLMIIDESVAIQGNGNLDTQSFYHSQEVNFLLDSPFVCRAWREAIDRNQNTALYGAVSPDDGCWHDPETNELPAHSIGIDPGHFSWAKGAVGAVQRVRGAGGF